MNWRKHRSPLIKPHNLIRTLAKKYQSSLTTLHRFSIPHNNMAYQKATLLSNQMINKSTFYYEEKAKAHIPFLNLHKAHPSPTPLQNLKNHRKLHHSSILTPQKQQKTTARTPSKPHIPLPSEKKRFSNHPKIR